MKVYVIYFYDGLYDSYICKNEKEVIEHIRKQCLELGFNYYESEWKIKEIKSNIGEIIKNGL